ncbi:MAG TPA: hypothetical protein VFI54_06245 [Solirubrobacteraceae bacterium]|nr:hypothetical protein [Solirubrobacteraceae bacterium]
MPLERQAVELADRLADMRDGAQAHRLELAAVALKGAPGALLAALGERYAALPVGGAAMLSAGTQERVTA